MSKTEMVPNKYLKKEEDLYKKSVGMQRRVNYAAARREISVNEKIILYTSFHGRGLTCNPYALFCYMKNDERFKDFIHVWVLDNIGNHSVEMKEYEDDENVIFVQLHSQEYMWYLSAAKYLINNVTEQSYFVPKPEQIVINTWHGIPLKHLGYDTPDGVTSAANSVRNFMFSDYVISPCAFMTQTVYGDAYKLRDAYEGKVIEAGYPRCDLIFNSDRNYVIEKLLSYGMEIDPNKKIILYAPTWRGEKYGSPNIDLTMEKNFIDNIKSQIDLEEYQILFKPHQVVYKHLQDKGMLEPYFIPAAVDANEILSITDILISDYSSIFFDFLVTQKPIFFYVPDKESYKDERGFYFNLEELPGPISDDAVTVSEWLHTVTKDADAYWELFDREKYDNARNQYTGHEDGQVCERVIDAIFNGSDKYTVKLKSNKIKLLFHLDRLLANGISMSLINLLNSIDYDKYDVTFNLIVSQDNLNAVDIINKNVRVLARTGATVLTINEVTMKDFCHDNAIVNSDNNPIYPRKMYEVEFVRSFGRIKYDCIINFSGYNGFWTNTFCAHKEFPQLIWLHNDMQLELEKVVNGVPLHEKNLLQVFKDYKDVDKIVGCSKSTAEINREKLGTPETYDKFTYVHNMIDIERVERLRKEESKVASVAGRDFLISNELESKDGCFEQTFIPMPDENCINFVNVARLSPEKNQENLIRAFARLYEQDQRVRLYILGEGPLRRDLLQLIKDLHLTGKVILTGNIENPFVVEDRCQCFILPSNHEGFPMVLLEARMMGLPIIVSDFSTVEDCLYENGQLLIEKNVASIYEGMKAFLEGKVPNEYKFDAAQYNKKCLEEFDRLIQESMEEHYENQDI